MTFLSWSLPSRPMVSLDHPFYLLLLDVLLHSLVPFVHLLLMHFLLLGMASQD
jgi:hypothetical protein